jgi:hypothetical protein
MKRLKFIGGTALAVAVSILCAPSSFAAVSADEAKQLGTTLTRFGADAKANADGSIPAYTGGLKKSHPDGADQYADPFVNEKPLYSISAKNMGEYQALLGEGTRTLLQRFPTYRLDVYPTHRSMAYADWFLDNTVKNATTAKLGGSVEGDKVTGTAADGGAYQGIPFPIPKNGYEVMWNAMFHFAPPIAMLSNSSWLVDTNGGKVPLPNFFAAYMHPWSEQTGKLRKEAYDAVFGFWTTLTSPPTQAGTVFLNYYLPDAAAPTPIWIYTPGQRRVRKAPEFAYDIPMSAYAGVLFWDEPWGFVGRMDRFNMKLVGKKEMIIPYNTFGVTNQKTSEEALGKQHVNPEAVRWEKHRVWVVEGTRKEGARHAYSKRVFYVEEDCWCIVGTESYDNAGKLWRIANVYQWPAYDVGGVNGDTFDFIDVQKGNYLVINTGVKDKGNYVRHYKNADGLTIHFNPQAVAAGSVR